ncbi:receptor-like protein kinase THESEUS 1 [Neltuma alba]|uniref:receptor-like protein kinase THESEUS 1 n=1 Tax=Neltuma alba TaxID=207710 RepID=UPI0010A4B6DE|nr:receptor-like protein kinase THESEUS 1 [Prosopis alba]
MTFDRSKMRNLEFYYSLILLLFIIHSSCSTSTDAPLDSYFIACGSSNNITHLHRTFVPDSQQPSVTFDSEHSDIINSSRTFSPIYQSARTFSTSASYNFDMNHKGWHFVRLYFYPLSKTLASASFSVVAGSYVLLDRFSFNTSKHNSTYLFKEFVIYVSTDILILTFVPFRDSDVAFANAIEVVSIPDKIFSFGHTLSFPKLKDTALETMYRLNMGGHSLVPSQNSTLFRVWEEDDKYLQPNPLASNISGNPFSIKSSSNDFVSSEVAPADVYATAKALKNILSKSNLTWVFPASPNFKYILRMHFCDIISKSRNSLFFNVYVNSEVVMKNLNLSAFTYDIGVPYVIDYVTNNTSEEDSDNLSVTVEAGGLEQGLNAILNGLEILKMSNDVRNLDGLSSVDDIFSKSDRNIPRVALIISSCGMAALLLFACVIYYFYGRIRAGKSNITLSNNEGRLRIFTFEEIQKATNNFDKSYHVGNGGFGKVFMGQLKDGTMIATKKANPQSNQGIAEFQNEIKFLSKLRHQNLVSLLGYCYEDNQMVLVYAYMVNGSLDDLLYGKNVVVPLSWRQRLEICIGAATGLHYLHTGTGGCQSIIHRDVKAANILLDENLVAKVSDFGISRSGPSSDKSHVTTVVKGSFGYLDPEYFRTQRLTEKSDVYSFGIVLLEVLCGRPALNRALPVEAKNLANWALRKVENDESSLEEIIDARLIGDAKRESVKKVWEVAKMCLEGKRIKRPTMGYVMSGLQDALHLHLHTEALASY